MICDFIFCIIYLISNKEMSDGKSKIACGLSCLVCIFFLVLIIVLVGVGTVEPTEYGIIYNKFSKQVNKEEGVKPGGWYWIGWTNNFIMFPATQVNMDFTNYNCKGRCTE